MNTHVPFRTCLAMLACLLCLGSRAQLTFSNVLTPTSRNLMGISFDSGGNTGYACGDTGTVIKTTNGGGSWTMLSTGTTEMLWDIKVVPGTSGQQVIAVGDNNTVIKSVDGGSNWSAQSIPFQSGSFVFGIQCLDSLNYILCGGDYATFSGAVAKTSNGGASWSKVAVSGSIFLDKVMFADDSTVFAVGTNSSFSDGSIQRSTDGGSNWSTVKTSTDIITNLWPVSRDTIVAVGLAGQLLRSTDRGSNWSSHDYDATDLYGIRFSGSQKAVACGGLSDNIILYTANGGVSWSQVSYNFNGVLQSVVLTPSAVYVAGEKGHIAKASLSTGIQKHPSQDMFIMYPNPAGGHVQFKSAFPQPVNIEICNVQGKKMVSVQLENGHASLSLDQLPAGVYFVKCSVPGHEPLVKKLEVYH